MSLSYRVSSFCLALVAAFVAPKVLANQVSANYAGVNKQGTVAIATVQPKATELALMVAESGGNAIDVAVAAALALGVVDQHNSGIGGGCFALIRYADGTIEALDGREMAPLLAHRDMYLKDGVVQKDWSRTGALAVGIPGSLAVFEHMQQRGGKKSFAELLNKSADLAEQGFAIDGIYARRIARHQEAFKRFAGANAILLDDKGQPWPQSHHLVQKDLANTYRAIAKHGSEYFYRGEFAKQVAAWMKVHGGIISEKDFADYQMKIRKPVRMDWQGYQVLGFPPPSSGGLHVAQILKQLEHFDLATMSEADRYHVISESMRLAFADRAQWLGDPDFVDIPNNLLHEDYLVARGAKISADQLMSKVSAGTKKELDLFDKHTTHIAAADKYGNWVAITTTVNTDFGSKVAVPGTGVFLNNQMDDFTAQPGVANIYGLMGQEANAVGPRKRPLSSMSPTLVLNAKDEPVMTLGAAGGPTIITQVAQTLINHVVLKDDLRSALERPRIHQQWRPEILYLEKNASDRLRQSLEKKGHQLKTLGPYGSTQAIALDKKGGFVAVSEPRLIERNKPKK